MNGGTKDNEVFIHEDMVSSKPIDVHGVTAAEVSKQPLILYLYTGRQEYLDAALGFYSSVERETNFQMGYRLHMKACFLSMRKRCMRPVISVTLYGVTVTC